MIKRRLSSSLIVGVLSNLLHSHLYHHRRGFCCLMASSPSSLMIGNSYNHDQLGFHFFSTALRTPKIISTTHYRRFQSLSLDRISGDHNNHDDCNSTNNGNRSRSRSSSSYKAQSRAFSPCLPNLLRCDSDKINGHVKEVSSRQDDANLLNKGVVGGQSGAYHTLGFPDPPLSEKIVVAVDVDEVLGNFISALNRFIADRYSLNRSVSEYHVYEFFKIWNCSRDEADIRVHEFFKTSYFKTGILPIPGAQQALQKLSRFCDLSVVTSRQNVIKDHTIEWIEKHFPGLFQEIHFGNHFALDGQSRPKSDICRSLGAKILIDDNPRYATECADAGIKVLLFDYENSYPWCKAESVAQHPLVVKVHNWQEVEHQLVSQIVS